VPIPTKAKWQEYKTLYGIPDGLNSGVKMGDCFQTWITNETAMRRAHNYEGCLKEIEKLVVAMASYAKILKAAPANKFKGKTPSEQQANYNGANNKFKEIFGEVSRAKATYVNLAKPLLGVQIALTKAETKLKSLKATSPQEAWQTFYSQEFRGINLPLKQLEAINTDPGIKRGIIGFKSHANLLNNMLANGGKFNGSEAFGTAHTALALLSGEVGRK